MSTKRVLFGLALLFVITATGRSQDTGRTFSSTTGQPNDVDPSYFEFSVGDHNFKITKEGKGSVRSAIRKVRFFDLHLSRGDRLNGGSIYSADYKGDLLLL